MNFYYDANVLNGVQPLGKTRAKAPLLWDVLGCPGMFATILTYWMTS